MRKILLALAVWGAFFLPAPPLSAGTGATICDQLAVVNFTTKTTQEVATGQVGQVIYICGIFVASEVGNTLLAVQLEYGTNGPCTTPTAMTAVLPVDSGATGVPGFVLLPFIQPAPMQAPSGADVCLVVTGTTIGNLRFLVSYAQHI